MYAIGQLRLVNVHDVLFSTRSQQAMRGPLGVTMQAQLANSKDFPPKRHVQLGSARLVPGATIVNATMSIPAAINLSGI